MTLEPIAQTPKPPYYAVIFSSVYGAKPDDGYIQTAEEMIRLAALQDGFLGVESADRTAEGFGITVSYWRDEDAIKNWKNQADHLAAQQAGVQKFYKAYTTRIARVERDYEKA